MAALEKGFLLSTLAGTCAGLASVFGKLAFSEGQWFIQRIAEALCLLGASSPSPSPSSSKDDSGCLPPLEAALRVGCFGMVFVCNMVMWNLFVKSMNFSSSVMATVVNSATNFFSSALLGHLIFAEPLPATWWIGSSLIVAGLFFLAKGDVSSSAHPKAQ